jgi:hypothetical protein
MTLLLSYILFLVFLSGTYKNLISAAHNVLIFTFVRDDVAAPYVNVGS